MIGYLKGKIVRTNGNSLILDVAGVGYKIFTGKSYDSVDEFFIHEVIREDCHDLYGFVKYEELILFEKLISVNGVGPKAALTIMSSASVDQVESAIIGNNIDFLIAVPGIGKKVAAKIILELKSKLSKLDSEGIIQNIDTESSVSQALSSLGYKKSEISLLVSKMPKDISSEEEKIRWCLKNMK